MAHNRFFGLKNNLIYKSFLILSLILNSSSLSAQSPTNFSGKWAFDKSRSNPGQGGLFLDGDRILEITQNSTSIIFAETLIREGDEDIKNVDTFNFDGKEKIVKGDFGTTKNTLKWSEDKKILTVTTIMTTVSKGISEDYLVADSYKLSNDGRTLTIESYSKNRATGERTITMVYNKK